MPDPAIAAEGHDPVAPLTPLRSQRLGVYGLSVVDSTILLVRASMLTEVPGRWFLPGGGVLHGEHPRAALVREVEEETGLSATVGDLLGVLSDIRTRSDGTQHHTVRLIYSLDELRGDLRHEASGSSDLARRVTFDEARQLPIAIYVKKAAALVGIDLQSTK